MSDLEIFISWSRPGSRQAAEVFKEWLPDVLPGVKPWVSSEDITKGTSWFNAITDQLDSSRACLNCVTPDNIGSPWLFYEAGAIAHAMRGALICPYLIGVKPPDLAGTPLGQYQTTVFDKDDTWLLLRGLNERLAAPHNEGLLRDTFDAHWPALQSKLVRVFELVTSSKPLDTPDDSDLSAEARHVLVETAKDGRGILTMSKNMHSFDLAAHGIQLDDANNPRVEAAYREAVNNLNSSTQ